MTIKNEELRAFLNHTDNQYLIEYRKEFRAHPYRFLFSGLVKTLKIKLLSLVCKGDIKLSYKRRSALDKAWIIAEINRFREDRKLAEHSTRMVPLLVDNELVAIDEKIALPVFCLNKMGIKTSFCCEGHQRKNKESYSLAYIALSGGHTFPKEPIELLKENGVKYRLEMIGEKFFKRESLYPYDFNGFNDVFVETLNKWAFKHSNMNLLELKKDWKA